MKKKKRRMRSPKQFTIKEISAKDACEYNEKCHSKLPKLHWSNIVRNKKYVCYGAFYNNECYAVGLWSSPISRYLDQEKWLELRRYAICENAPKYTASWMLSKMIKEIKNKFKYVTTLISYQDTEHHEGTIYKASSWIPSHVTGGNPKWNFSRDRNTKILKAKKIRWEYYL